jgi:ATP/maltotriose-dependent transcriptional regulator MalT
VSIEWELVGRQHELELVQSVLALPNRCGVFIMGAPGMGKTRLAREATQQAASHGTHVEWVAVTRSAALLPFGALLQLLPPPPEGTFATGEMSPVEMVVAALQARAGGRPVVLAVDDAHLLDDGAAAIVHYLATTGQAKIIVTARERVPMAEALTGLWKDELAERIELKPLSQVAVGQLVSSALTGPVASEATERIWRLSDGNPLMLREIVRQSNEDRAFTFSGIQWHWRGLATTGPRLDDLIAEHLRRLPDDAREVLRIAAFGQPLRTEVMQRLASEEQVAKLVDESLLVIETVEHRRMVRLSHPLYGEFLRAQMGAADTRAVKEKLANATVENGDLNGEDELRLAQWWVDTRHVGEPEILASAAARALLVGKPDEAQEFARAALAHGQHFRASLTLAEARTTSLPPQEIVPAFESIRTLAADDTQLAQWAVAALQATRFKLDDPQLMVSIAEDAIAAMDDAGLSDLVRGQLAVSMATLRTSDEDDVLGSSLMPPEDDLARIRWLASIGAREILAGRAASLTVLARSLIGPSIRLQEQIPGAPNLVWVIYCLALLAQGHFDEVQELLDKAASRSANRTLESRSFVGLMTGRMSLLRGQVRTAAIELRDAFDTCRQTRDPHTAWCAGLLVEALALSGDLDGADQVMTQMQDFAPFDPYDADRSRAATWLTASRGNLQSARDHLIELADEAHKKGRLYTELTVLHDALRLGAAGIADRLIDLATEVDGAWAAACGAHAKAVSSNDGAKLELAAALFEELGLSLHAAEVFGAAAATYSADGQRTAANRAAERSDAVLTRCEGASTLLTRIRPLAEPLTDRELQAAVLAAEGRTNPDIAVQLYISVRTVENHLHRAYGKLGIRTRSELAAALAPRR